MKNFIELFLLLCKFVTIVILVVAVASVFNFMIYDNSQLAGYEPIEWIMCYWAVLVTTQGLSQTLNG